MRATLLWPAALVLAAVSAYPACAQVVYCAPALQRPLGYAPDACGPGFYVPNNLGMVYGPSYYLRPWFPPEQGVGPGCRQNCYPGGPSAFVGQGLPNPALMPQLGGNGPPMSAAFPTHPYARSPRDFFMWSETLEDQMNMLRLPALVP